MAAPPQDEINGEKDNEASESKTEKPVIAEEVLELVFRMVGSNDEEVKEHEIASTSLNLKRCIICLGKYADGDKVKMLHCDHHYHSHCIDNWS